MMTRQDFDTARAHRSLILGIGSRHDGIWIINGEEPTERHVAQLAISLDDAIRALGDRWLPDYCRGTGTVKVMSDVWDNCDGCLGCRAAAIPAWCVGVAFWRWQVAEEHAELATAVGGLQGLAAIGRAVAAALAPGLAVATFLGHAVACWNTPAVGAWYRVTGKQGRAKEHHGETGECTWIETSTYRSSTTLRLTLTKPDGTKAYVAAGQCTRIPVPAVGQVRARDRQFVASRPVFCGVRGSTGYVIAGEHTGKGGQVIWVGEKNGTKRVGIKVAGEAEPLWLNAYDVAGEPLTGPHNVAAERTVWVESACYALVKLTKLGQLAIEGAA